MAEALWKLCSSCDVTMSDEFDKLVGLRTGSAGSAGSTTYIKRTCAGISRFMPNYLDFIV